MHTKTLLAAPLSALFASLLSGCPLYPSCESDTIDVENKVELTPEEYAQWQQGMMPGAATEPPTTGATDASSGPTTDASTTDASTGTTDASTGGASTGEPLTDDEVCTAVCTQMHGEDLTSCSVDAQADKVVITCNSVQYCVGGRGHACVRPLGLAAGPDAGAAWLARIAHDEAASVHAFRELAHELAVHGAPAHLLAELEAAALDELEHAALMSSLARAHGAEPTAPARVALPARGLLALAVENAVEGCVHETWAALSAAHQARRAVDPSVRAVFAGIAADEARHAELAWKLDAWLADRLDAHERATVLAARRSAARELTTRLGAATDEPALLELGLPSARVAAHLSARLADALWSSAA